MKTRRQQQNEEEENAHGRIHEEEMFHRTRSNTAARENGLQTRGKGHDKGAQEKKEIRHSVIDSLVKSSNAYVYPPKKFSITKYKNEEMAAQISIDSANFLVENWSRGRNCILIDNTNSVKYASISIMIEKILLGSNLCPPFLIISNFSDISIWLEQLSYWTTQNYIFCSNTKSEKQGINDANVIFSPTHPEHFSIMLISTEQYQREPEILPDIKWGSIIIDDYDSNIDISILSYHQRTIISLENIEKHGKNDVLFEITTEVAAENLLYEETALLCPLVPIQQKAYLEALSNARDMFENGEPSKDNVQKLVKELWRISDHPKKGESELGGEIALQGAKTTGMSRLLSQQKQESRKVAIICSKENTPTVRAAVEETHATIKNDYNELKKSSGYAVLITTADGAIDAIKAANTIIVYDISWTPDKNAEDVISWFAHEESSVIYRLIAANTVDALIFENFWRQRKIQKDFDSSIIWAAVKRAHDNMNVVKSLHRNIIKDTITLAYSDFDVFPEDQITRDIALFDSLVPTVAEAPIKMRTITAAHFWTLENLQAFIPIYTSFSYGRWDRYEGFERTPKEYVKLWVVFSKQLVRSLGTERTDFPKLTTILKEHGKFDQKRLMNSLTAWSQVFPKLDAEEILSDLENLFAIDQLYLSSDNGIETGDPEMAALIPKVYNEGLHSLTDEELPRFREFMKKATQLVKNIAVASPKRSHTRSVKKFDTGDHNSVTNTLMAYGLTQIDDFCDIAGLSMYPPEFVQSYIDTILKFCNTPPEERHQVPSGLVTRIVKYHASKIPARIELFNKIREASKQFDEYSAENIEFLRALSSHGFITLSTSPVLTCLCHGTPTEPKLYNRVKSLFTETNRHGIPQHFPENILDRLPIRVNDMQMLLCVGDVPNAKVVDGYLMPVGYSLAVVAPSLESPDLLIWNECIIEAPDRFVIRPYEDSDASKRIEGGSAERVWEIFRECLAKKRGTDIGKYDGIEMFGLTTALVQRVFAECSPPKEYPTRFFAGGFTINQKWPIIGQFEKEAEKPVIAAKMATSHFKFKKKLFGDLPPPLVLDLDALAADEKERFTVDFIPNSDPSIETMIGCYDQWGEFDGFLKDR